MKLTRRTKKNILRFSSLVLYIVLTFVILIEAMMTGPSSAKQSNSVGGAIASFVNNLCGDRGKQILPNQIIIDNPIYEAYVGDEHQIKCDIYPSSTTNRSLTYKSTDEHVASINETGKITFIGSGETTIQVFSTAKNEVSATFNVIVRPVSATSLTCSINAPQNEQGVYIFKLGSQYSIQYTIEPSNATSKKLTFSSSSSDISINEHGLIETVSYDNGSIHTIKVKHKDLDEVTLKYYVDTEISKVALEGIEATFIESIYVSQVASCKVSFIPSNSSYTSYYLESDDNSIISISSLSYRGVKEGKTKVRVISSDFPSIYFEKEIQVLPLNTITSFAIKSSYSLNVGSSLSVTPYSIQPAYSDTSKFTYSVEDSSICSVNNKGVVRGLKEGSTTLTCKTGSLTRTTTISVNPKPVVEEDIKVTLLKGEVYLLLNNTYDLNEYIQVKNYKGFSSQIDDCFEGTFDSFKPTLTGDITLTLQDTNLKTKDVKIHVIPSYNVTFSKDSLLIGEEGEIKIEGENLEFKIQASSSLIISKKDESTYIYKASFQDEASITVTPIFEGNEISKFKTSHSVVVNDIYTTKLNINFYDIDSSLIEKDYITLFVGSKVKFSYTLDKNTTRSYVEYYIEDSEGNSTDNVTFLTKDTLLAKGVGNYYLVANEKYSSLQTRKLIKVRNIIGINEDNPVDISLNSVSKKGDTYTLINGLAYKIEPNFISNSTYTKVQYVIEDESILQIGNDGNISVKKQGQTKVKIIIDDGVDEPIQKEITIVVSKKSMIMNMDKFFLKVRKAIGHFGAFLVLGIFAAGTYLLFLDRNWILRTLGIILTLGSGFFIAGLSEWIQLYVDGRCGAWSDVWIDYMGYLVSTIISIVVMIVLWVIKDHKQKEKLKSE